MTPERHVQIGKPQFHTVAKRCTVPLGPEQKSAEFRLNLADLDRSQVFLTRATLVPWTVTGRPLAPFKWRFNSLQTLAATIFTRHSQRKDRIAQEQLVCALPAQTELDSLILDPLR